MEYVKLKDKDLDLLIDVMDQVIKYKFQALTKVNWIKFEQDYLPTLLESINKNQFKVVSTHESIIVWIIDQILHARKIVEGVPKRDWIPLADLEKVQECLRFLRAARLGQQSYNLHGSEPHYHNLFD